MYMAKAAIWSKKQQDVIQKLVVDHLLQNPCVDCGEPDLLVLEFDHVRGKKLASISDLMAGKHSYDKVVNEISKCEVRCCNCHARKTAKQLGYWRLKFATVV